MAEKSSGETKSKSFNPPYVQPNPRWFCVFCTSSKHSSVQCHRYQDSNKFWQRVLVDRRCRNCLRLFHRADKCYNESLCHLKGCKRQDKHNPVLCHHRYKNQYWPNSYKRSFENAFQFSHIRDSHFSNNRTCKVENNFSPVSKVDASTQTEVEFSTETLGINGNKVAVGCQTDFQSIINMPVCLLPSKDDSEHDRRMEDKNKLNYNGHSSDDCSVKDSEKLIRSLHLTQPKTAELLYSLRSVIFQLQQKNIEFPGYSPLN